MQERHVRVLSDDVTDPIALKALWNALQAVHDAEGVYRHPGQRQMELGMNACWYTRRAGALIKWFRNCCRLCVEKVCNYSA